MPLQEIVRVRAAGQIEHAKRQSFETPVHNREI
jgi:hypothetical protein